MMHYLIFYSLLYEHKSVPLGLHVGLCVW